MPKLYYFIGYPGAGKTTLSKAIADKTGAIHIWADDERHKLFPETTHSSEESLRLYHILNDRVDKLLGSGESVIFDTNFNHFHDREVMRRIARNNNAEAVLIWLDLPIAVARTRAVHSNKTRNGYSVTMSNEQFDSITSKLEKPKEGEDYIKISTINFDTKICLSKLGIN